MGRGRGRAIPRPAEKRWATGEPRESRGVQEAFATECHQGRAEGSFGKLGTVGDEGDM